MITIYVNSSDNTIHKSFEIELVSAFKLNVSFFFLNNLDRHC